MASNISDSHKAAHDALHEALAPFHDEMQRLAAMEQEVRIKRAIAKAVAAQEVTARASALKISADVAARAAAMCW